MKHPFARKLALSFCLILTFFALTLLVFEMPREAKHKAALVEKQLDAYTGIVRNYMQQHNILSSPQQADSLLAILPVGLRLTVIDHAGEVLYDNHLDSLSQVENHASREEMLAALAKGFGSDIRVSASTSQKYFYYAKSYGNDVIRVALPYNIQLQTLLRPDSTFFLFLLLLLGIGMLFAWYTARRFGMIIKRLRDFSQLINQDTATELPAFPKDEIGEISRQIAAEYQRIKESEQRLELEQEKLLMHIQASAEGICFFTSDRKVAFYNSLFLQYLNIISDEVISDLSDIFHENNFERMINFLDNREEERYFETVFHKQGKYFSGHINLFDDNSFEIVLNDKTRQEQNRILKQELTGNIAHELRTPVTGIRGYLESILHNSLSPEKQQEFIHKAYEQTLALSELIRNMSLLAKINEAPEGFRLKPVRLQAVIQKVQNDLDDMLRIKKIRFHSSLPPDLEVMGNESLLYSVFRNLTDNTLAHAGEKDNLCIEIKLYSNENNRAHISFADNGTGITDEQHLTRLFERFYRVEEGRTRENGGSGLGLSIVKNVIGFHGGNITAKNRVGGGLEFLFTLNVG